MRYLEIPGIYQEFYRYMLGRKIYISDRLKRQLGREEWRRLLLHFVGSFTTDKRKGIPIDSLYCEMIELFPWLFHEDITAEEDQIYTVFDIYDMARQKQNISWANGTTGKEETLMKVISIINLKGGVAKTISSANIAHILAAVHGYNVLLIDNDKQGNISKQFNRHSYDRRGTESIMTDKGIDLKEIIQHTDFENLDIITANMNLLKANLEVLLDQTRPQQTRFKKAFQTVQGQYDYIIIDNAPDINISTINALVASDYVMVPIKIDKYSMDGMEELADQINETKEDLNPELKFLGWFTTQFVNNPVNVQGEEILRNQHDYPYFDTHIRRTEKVDESTFSSLPINVYSKRCGAAKDYLDLVDEFLQKTANA